MANSVIDSVLAKLFTDRLKYFKVCISIIYKFCVITYKKNGVEMEFTIT